MTEQLGGIHHVTAVTGAARNNLDFYTTVLGLRLVKKTVNQDVTSSYHLFYADGVGTAGTDMTFFDWPNVPRHRSGNGDVSATAFMIPDGSIHWWTGHFDRVGVAYRASQDSFRRSSISFVDPEGQRLQLVEGGRHDSVPWTESPIPVEQAIRGLGCVLLTVAKFEPTALMLSGLLGFRRAGEYALDDEGGSSVTVFETGPGGLGAEVHLLVRPSGTQSQVGIGGVHHVAFRTPDAESHERWRDRLAGAGVAVTDVIDRYYFRSIYFREPGGVLFEIATDGPGFAQDEDLEHLGEALSLPPFLEPRRTEIEAQLQPL